MATTHSGGRTPRRPRVYQRLGTRPTLPSSTRLRAARSSVLIRSRGQSQLCGHECRSRPRPPLRWSVSPRTRPLCSCRSAQFAPVDWASRSAHRPAESQCRVPTKPYRESVVGRRSLSLPLPEVRVRPPTRDQFLVNPPLDDLTLIHHDDLVGVLNRRKPVGDDERGSLLD